jgi:putative hydrolase of the HAD superfamily
MDAVLFDLDETLLDRSAALRSFLADQYDRFRQELASVSPAEYQAAFFALEEMGIVDKQLLYPRLVAGLSLTDGYGNLLLSDFQTRYPSFARLSVGALETLAALRALGLKTAIVSNGRGVVQSAKIAMTGLSNAVDLVVISETAGLRKPDPRIFELAATRLGTMTSRCVFIGDNPEADVRGAEAAGVTGIFYAGSGSWPDALPPPRYRIDTLTEILELLPQLT